MKLKLSGIPHEIINEYNLLAIATQEVYVYIEFGKGMYSLLQAWLIAQELLEMWFIKEGYFSDGYIPGLWYHEWHPLQCTLIVDDFGVKYIGDTHAKHQRF